MLIEFTVSNFRSFREPQTFSMAAAPRLRQKEYTLEPNVVGEKLPNLHKVAAIYGPNASGKSALLRAMKTIPALVERAPEAVSRPLSVWPFRYDSALLSKPSEFEYHFIADGLRYQLTVAMTADRITYERLACFPKGKEEMLYARSYMGSSYAYKFGRTLEGSPDLHEAWKHLTGPRTMFLAQAVANSSEELTQLRSPYKWIASLRSMDSSLSTEWAQSTQKLAKDHPRFAKEIAEFLSNYDIPIVGMRFEQEESVSESHDVESSVKRENIRTFFTHRSALGPAEFAFGEESEGTQALIGFWLPWSAIGEGDGGQFCNVLLVDEIDSSLHPKIVENLIRSHLKLQTQVQVIFTTHDTHLMNTKLLRRDQIWLTERDKNAATQLRSIHEYTGREGEDVEKRYFEGRYRGLPILSE